MCLTSDLEHPIVAFQIAQSYDLILGYKFPFKHIAKAEVEAFFFKDLKWMGNFFFITLPVSFK